MTNKTIFKKIRKELFKIGVAKVARPTLGARTLILLKAQYMKEALGQVQ